MSLIDDLTALLGPANVLTGEAALEKVHTIFYPVGAPKAVLRPGSTQELSAALKLCHAAGQAVVPFGGLTNLVESAHTEDQVAITLERMAAIEALDTVNATLTVQAGARLQTAQEAAEEAGLVADAVLAKSAGETAAMWAVRDDIGQTARDGPIYLFDVSLKIGDMEAYVGQVRQALTARFGARFALWVFGHMGDGNLHLNIGVGEQTPDKQHAVEHIVYEPLRRIGGSISAEHGIGLHKRDFLPVSRSPEEIAVMGRLKEALDPAGILNPGKVLID